MLDRAPRMFSSCSVPLALAALPLPLPLALPLTLPRHRNGNSHAPGPEHESAALPRLLPAGLHLTLPAGAPRETLQALALRLPVLPVLLAHALSQVFELLPQVCHLLLAQLLVLHAREVFGPLLHVLRGLREVSHQVLHRLRHGPVEPLRLPALLLLPLLLPLQSLGLALPLPQQTLIAL